MLQASTVKFLKDLKKNNNKPWFDAHRPAYETAKQDFYGFTEKLIAAISTFDTSISHLTAKECTFRINRDVRFSKNKTPYKNNMAAYFNRHGKKGIGAGYYLHVEPGNSFAAGGIWMPEAPVLAKIRQEVDYNYDAWKKMVKAPAFKKIFPAGLETENKLSRPPKGYEENNPAIEILKLKSFIVSCPVDDEILAGKDAVKNIGKIFTAMKPLVDFINLAAE